MENLDKDIINFAKATRQVESGGDPKIKGGSKEIGYYQYTPDTWNAQSKKYKVNVLLENATPEQQNEVFYKWVKEKKDAGYNLGQISSMHNAGEGKPNAYKEDWKGVNKYGVSYDTPAYAKKVAENYQKLKTEIVSRETSQPEIGSEIEPEKRDGFFKSLVKPVATTLARPLQLGAELIMPGDNTEAIDRFSKEKLGGYVAPIPQNIGDVKKDFGRAVQTVAFGMPGLASAGAAFGVGASMEEGNNLFSAQTAFQGIIGAVGAKVLGLVGKPLLNATGKVIGKITPQIIINVASKGARAITEFAAAHKILPEAISKVINRGAIKAETIINKPFELTGQVVKRLTTKSEQQIERAILTKYEKGVKPLINAKTTPSKLKTYKEDVVVAVKTIKENKANLTFKDADGIEITGKNPKSLQQMADAIEQTKKKIFSLYDKLAKEAGEAGIKINTNPIITELDTIVGNKALQLTNPNAIRYAKATQLRYAKVGNLDAVTTQDVIQNYNNSLQAFYKNPSYDNASNAAIDAMIANRMRQSLDDGITKLTGTQYGAFKKQYGALKSIETDVIKASLRDARKNVKGLIDFTDIFSGGQVVNGILSLNPAQIASGLTQKGIATYYKFINNPNRAIENLFKFAERLPKLSIPSFTKSAVMTPKVEPKVELKVKSLKSNVTTEIGITSFRGKPVKTIGETAPYYETTRAKGFVNSIESSAKDFNVSIKTVTKVAGSWEGSIEPSYSVIIKGSMKDKLAYAVTNAQKANQDAVILFTKGKGNGTKYSFENVKNPDKALKVLHANGVSGATIYKNNITVYDMDNSLAKKLKTFISLTGNKPTKLYGKIQLIEKQDYAKYRGGRGDGNSVRAGQTAEVGPFKPDNKKLYGIIKDTEINWYPGDGELNQYKLPIKPPKLSKSTIVRDKTLKGENAKIQEASISKYEKNPEQLLKQYKQKFGKNIVNTDNARILFKDVGYNGSNSAAVHEASSVLAKDVWRHNLTVNKESYAILYSGMSGSGKSTALAKIPKITKMLDDAAAILDGNLSTYSSALDRITEATKANKIPSIVHIYRDPVDAFEFGIVKRMNNIKSPDYGRIVPIKYVVKTSQGSRKTLEKLLKTAEEIGMPKEYIIIIDNSFGFRKAKETSLEQIQKKLIPENLETLLNNKAKELYGKGTITKEQFEKFLQ